MFIDRWIKIWYVYIQWNTTQSLGLQGDPTSQFQRKSVLNIHWKDWCWSWSSNTLATWCEELTHWKRPWCWERLKGGGEGDDRGWDGWMASPTRWTWIWENSMGWWWTGKTGVLQSMGSQRVRHDWTTELMDIIKEWNNALCSNMDADIIILSEVSQERQIPYDHSHVESKIWHKWTYLWDIENRQGIAKGEWGCRREEWEVGVSRCKLLYTEWINDRVLLYGTENYTQYPMTNYNGKEY